MLCNGLSGPSHYRPAAPVITPNGNPPPCVKIQVSSRVGRGGQWPGLGGRRRSWLAGAWTSVGKPSLQAQGVQRGVDPGGVYLPQTWAAQRVDALVPTAILPMTQNVLHAPAVAYHPQQSPGAAPPGTQAGQRMPALMIRLPGGRTGPLFLRHHPLSCPGRSQFVPDTASQRRAGPDAPSFEHPCFFQGLSSGCPSSRPATPRPTQPVGEGNAGHGGLAAYQARQGQPRYGLIRDAGLPWPSWDSGYDPNKKQRFRRLPTSTLPYLAAPPLQTHLPDLYLDTWRRIAVWGVAVSAAGR